MPQCGKTMWFAVLQSHQHMRRYGVSWQIIPKGMIDALTHPNNDKRKKAFEAMVKMKKIDVAAIKNAMD